MKIFLVFLLVCSNILFSQKITSIKLEEKLIVLTNINLENIEVSDQLVTIRDGKKRSYIIVKKIEDSMITGKIIKGTPKFDDKVEKGNFYIFQGNKNKKRKMEFNVGLGVETITSIKSRNSDAERISFSPNFKINLGLDIPLKIFKKDFLVLLNLNSNVFQTKAEPVDAPNKEEWSYYSMNFTTDLAYLISKNIYARAGVGTSYLNYKGKINSHNQNQDSIGRPRPFIGTYNETFTGMSFGPGLGYILKTKKNKSIKFDIGYNFIKNFKAESENPLNREITKDSFNKIRVVVSFGL